LEVITSNQQFIR